MCERPNEEVNLIENCCVFNKVCVCVCVCVCVAVPDAGEDPLVTRAKFFIRDQFLVTYTLLHTLLNSYTTYNTMTHPTAHYNTTIHLSKTNTNTNTLLHTQIQTH